MSSPTETVSLHLCKTKYMTQYITKGQIIDKLLLSPMFLFWIFKLCYMPNGTEIISQINVHHLIFAML